MRMLGRQYTWCNALDRDRWSRIDRFLLDFKWMENLPRTISDHCPMLLKVDNRDWRPKPFKFINAWLSHPSFMSKVKKWERKLKFKGGQGSES
ncbi:hypothetical protein ACSBR2_035772 [Camellia fascicularis]